ncbi:MAG TPA: DUF2520 domain-containing protein [Blastocatellia bacterium]|nr:DUF2520 domain-containing protein [Blastocatellia bacterium]
MRITIIGAGRVGQTLGRLAAEAGYEIGELVCRSKRSARAAARFIGQGEAQSARDARLRAADIILIATPDDHIKDAVKMIEGARANFRRAVVLHVSGAMSSEVLAPLKRVGFATGSCHPLQSFESPEGAIGKVRSSFFCIEGSARASRAARRLVDRIGASHFEIATAMKGLYHAAGVMASGGVTALVSISLEMLSRCGLSETEAMRVLLPLVEGTIANVRAVGPARALTGPVKRGDAGTVERNMMAMDGLDRDWVEAYRLLARRNVELVGQSGGDKQALEKVRRILSPEC